MSDYDSPWKEALDSYFQQFMAFFFPQAHAAIDWSRGYEALDKELQQVAHGAAVGRRVVDKLIKVWRKDGTEEWVLIHIEVQSQEEGDFPLRMYIYNYRLFDKYNHSVCSLAVLGDDRASWRPDHFGYDLWGCRVSFQFPIVKLLDYAPQVAALESHPNPFAAVVLAHLKTRETRADPDARRVWKVRLIKSLYDRGLGAEDVRQLFKFIDCMMDLPEVLNNLFWDEVAQYEKEKHMPFMTTPERIGLKKGLLRGIEVAMQARFGAEGVKLLPDIRLIQDHEVLEKVLDTINTVTTPDELRRVWMKSEQGQ